jgi:hypothetical protein
VLCSLALIIHVYIQRAILRTYAAREIVNLTGSVADRSMAAPPLGAEAEGSGPEADGVDDWTRAARLMSLSQV